MVITLINFSIFKSRTTEIRTIFWGWLLLRNSEFLRISFHLPIKMASSRLLSWCSSKWFLERLWWSGASCGQETSNTILTINRAVLDLNCWWMDPWITRPMFGTRRVYKLLSWCLRIHRGVSHYVFGRWKLKF